MVEGVSKGPVKVFVQILQLVFTMIAAGLVIYAKDKLLKQYAMSDQL